MKSFRATLMSSALACVLMGSVAGASELGVSSGSSYPGGAAVGSAFAETDGGIHDVSPELLRRVVERQRQRAIRAGITPAKGALPTADLEVSKPPAAFHVMPSQGNVKVFALLIEFPDKPHEVSQTEINSALYGDGNPEEAPYESMANFYTRASHGLLNLQGGVTYGWWTANDPISSIQPTNAWEWMLWRQKLIREAITYFNAELGVDFTEFDYDHDGTIDYFLVIHSGYGTGPMWDRANAWQWGSADPTVFEPDGMKLGPYSWVPEGATAPAIHETGHALGLPDLYDEEPDVGLPGGLGGYDPMDHSLGDFNCFSKWLLDWAEPVIVAAGTQAITLNPSATHRTGSCVFIMPGLTQDSVWGEFFVAEYRSRSGNDENQWFPAEGLWVWHVDATLDEQGDFGFRWNNRDTPRKLIRLMEADGLEQIEHAGPTNAGDVYQAGGRFGDGTFPSSRRYGGEPTGVIVTDIAKSGDQFTARFTVAGRVDGGFEHTLLVKSDGSLWSWGRNSNGQLGIGSTVGSLSPIQVGTDLDWRFASGGRLHSIAAKADGSLLGWGGNDYGQVGDGTTAQRTSPVPASNANGSAVVAGQVHSTALKVETVAGGLGGFVTGLTRWGWGFNLDGELGNGANTNVYVPTKSGSTLCPDGIEWAYQAVGFFHNLAIRIDGTLWAWGDNNGGKLGDGSTVDRNCPVQISASTDWTNVAAGQGHSLAVKRDGTLWAWGVNNVYQLGDGTRNWTSVPIQIGTDSDWSMVAASYDSSFALKRDGSLWAWGRNFYGQLGNDATNDRPQPTRIGSSADWDYVAAGEHYSLALKTDATLWGTGHNDYGQLGDGATADQKVFRQLLSTQPTYVDLSAVPSGPWQVGALITFTAAGSGGIGSYESQFWVNSGGTWSVRQDYSADNTWEWDTTGLAPGAYPVRVYVRNTGSVVLLEAQDSLSIDLLSTPTTYLLSVSKSGGGTGTVTSVPAGIECGEDCSESYTPGTSVALTATASAGSVFTGWTGACGGMGTCNVTMSSTQAVAATFEPTYALSVSKSGAGSGTVTSVPAGIDCGVDCSETYTSGTSVALTATASAGSVFTGWSGACSGGADCTVSMTSAQSVTASFEPKYTLSVLKSGSGAGTVTSVPAGIDCGADCAEDYASGTSVTLSATAAGGSVFTGWGGACTGTGSCAVTMTSGKLVTATFETLYTLSVSKSGNGGGTVTSVPAGINCGADCAEDYASGISVTLSAAPAAGSTFTGWGGACTGTGSCVVAMTAARSVSATFTSVPTVTLANLKLSKSLVAGCVSVTGTVTLSGPAPTGGVIVALSDTLPAASESATVTVVAGATTKTFTVKTTAVDAQQAGTVSASHVGTTLSQPLTIRPIGMSSVSLTPTSVVGGYPVAGKATLECKAGPGAITVSLATSNASVAALSTASVSVPIGATYGTFNVTTSPVLAKATATITGTANGIAKTKTLTVTMAAAVSPTSLKFGSIVVGQTGGPLNATLSNKGAVPYTVNSISLTGTYASWFAQTNDCPVPPATLAAGGSCTIGVTFKPLAVASKTAKLTIATSATSTALSVSLSGTGVAPPP